MTPAAPPHADPGGPPGERPSKLLIADDNLPNCELLEAHLADEGHTVEFAHDGAQTLEVARAAAAGDAPFDLVLLDIMMPKLSGYEVCQQLKSDAATAGLPVLMVTALNETGDIERAVEAGCDDFLTKPVNSLELKIRVRSLLRVRHLSNDRDRLLAHLAAVDAAADPRDGEGEGGAS